MCSSCSEFTKVVCFPFGFASDCFVGFGVGAGLLLVGAVKTLVATGAESSVAASGRPSSCSARYVSDLAGSYCAAGLGLRCGGGRGRGRGQVSI